MTSWVTFPDGFMADSQVIQRLWRLEASGYWFEPTADTDHIIVHPPETDESDRTRAGRRVRDEDALFILMNFDDIVACVQHDVTERTRPAA
jgi:hypothetical protein|tara:strand:- start:3083 stop:3355 length:273 start_codon:yes stop_codon:yes gene_type:complete